MPDLKKVAFKMQLKEGFVDEYKKRHDEIWPEIVELLKKERVSDYHIFFDEATHILFAIQTVSGDSGSQDLGQNPIIKKWWNHMADIMEVNADNSPVTTDLKEVFYLP